MMENDDLDFATIEACLGKAAYAAPRVRIYNCDCLQAMKELPDGIFDLTVTSPPYNIGKEYEDILDIDTYLSWCEQWIDQIYRISTPSSAFWLNLGYVGYSNKAKAIPLPYLLWNRVPFFLMQEIIWHYGAGVASRLSFSPRNEKFLWYVKNQNDYVFNLDSVRDPNVKYPNQKKNGKLKCNPLGKNPTDVWLFPKVTSGTDRSSPERTNHPAQFPVAVIERIIKSCSNRGNLILDPFMGSGTTALVASQLDRPVVGFELSPSYVDVARTRLNAFFEETRIASLQEELFARVESL